MRTCVLVVLSILCLRAQEGWEVTGTVTADSRPLKGMYVTMLGPSSIAPAVTDGQGVYSIKGVAPGQYRIAVQKKENTAAPEPKTLALAAGVRVRVDFRIPKGSAISGRVLDRSGRPVVGVLVQAFARTVADRKLRLYVQAGDRTNDLGEYRLPFLPSGAYVVAASSEPLKIRKRDPQSKPVAGAAYPSATFHPGVRDVQSAGTLDLRDGAERSGVDIVIQQVPAVCITFRAGSGFTGQRAGASLRARLGFKSPPIADSTIDIGGSYQMCGLTPGEYQLSITSTSMGTNEQFPGSVEIARTIQLQGYQMMTAVVGDRDLDLGTVEPLTFQDVRGNLMIRNARSEDPVPAGVRVRLVASELRAQYTDVRPAPVQPDGTFVLRQVFAGDYGVRVDLPAGYYLAGVSQLGKNVLDGGFYPGNGDLQIQLGSDGCQVTGRLSTEDGSVVPDVSVLLVREDHAAHHVTQTDQTGAYRFASGIAPGAYRLAAAPGLMGWQLTDIAAAIRAVGSGTEIKLNPGESRVIVLKVQPVP